MRVKLVPIGSSRGIRLPKAVLELCGATEGFELEIQGRTLILHPVRARDSWEESFVHAEDRGGALWVW